ncbi:hypothetical protein FXW78_40195 [Rhodococcus opacus]|nr:hypothetical protein [Rhodococcus opacus]RZL74600.1 MAG: hypothetical protein EOP32_33365 [Rhodococcus sp. (in: high G+C Gram-positive bacteria)]
MFARILSGALLTAAAATLALAPTASADPTPDWNTFHDKTANFVAPFDPGAFGEKGDRALVLSPYGTGRVIECKGDGHYVAVYCRQFDDQGREHAITQIISAPFRGVYVYNPF